MQLPKARWSWSTLLGGLTPVRGALVVVLVLQTGARAAGLVQPLIAREVVDGVEAGNGLVGPVIGLGVVALIGLVLNYLAFYQRGKVSERFVCDLREAVTRRLVGAPVPVIEQCPPGDVLSRVGADTTLVQQTTVKALVDVVVVPLTVIAGVLLMLYVDVFLALLVIGLLSTAALVEARVLRRVVTRTERAQEHLGNMTGSIQRVLRAFRTVKACRAEQREVESFSRHARSARKAGVRVARSGALADTVAYASVELTFLVVLAVGIFQVGSGRLGVGDLVAILLYVEYIQDPLESLTGSASRLSEGMAALRRTTGLLDLPQEPSSETPANPVPVVPGADRSLRLEHVWFRYGERDVLRDVTIEARPGLTVLVGPSGTGKTTVLSLAERFVEPDRGRILLNGTDIRTLPLADLRRHIAYVEQEAPLLGDTIRQSLTYGLTDVNEHRLWHTLSSVGLHEWVVGLPEGLDTTTGEGGATVSGGQRQRLAVARALLQDADVLLLDEATSQLDPANEHTLVRTLVRHHGDRIVIAVTHRMPLAQQADQVIMLCDGTVHAGGPHTTLLHDPAYQRLVASTTNTRQR
ncbi:ABC transporter ATP-binding protein [Crossiella sp. NPDC003009]